METKEKNNAAAAAEEQICGNAELLVLWGKANSGKSETISKLIDMMIDLGYKFAESDDSQDKIDRWFVFEIDGKRIGITTGGDDRKHIQKDMERMGKCDIYVAASHIKGQTVKLFKNLFSKENIYWIEKSRISRDDGAPCPEVLFRKSNALQAEEMLRVLEFLITRR